MVEVVGEMSTHVQPARIGGGADLLVCEIVDDQLLGEGVLAAISQPR